MALGVALDARRSPWSQAAWALLRCRSQAVAPVAWVARASAENVHDRPFDDTRSALPRQVQ